MLRTNIVVSLTLITLTSSAYCAHAQLGDPLKETSNQTNPQMTATLKMEELAATASIVEGTHILKLSVSNNGKRALLLDADSVKFPDGEGEQSLSRNEVIKKPSRQTFPEDAMEAGLSISTGGVGSVLVDEYNKAQNPGPAFYGKDEERRDIDESRFGKRLLFPGETSTGTMYLSKAIQKNGVMKVPVFSHPAGNELGTLDIQISLLRGTATTTAEKNKPAEKDLPEAIEKPLRKKQRIERRF